ncbi:MAG TPA: transposase [Candidatus Bathyarchaeia archaeon]|nr:transposase [Candidatus Bathyarchaeia archaeon]
MLAVKAIVQKHHASPNLLDLPDEFRRMVNVCIAVGMEENISSFKTLSLKSYHRLSPKVLSYYRLCAISAATGMLRNHRKAKKRNARAKIPCAKKLMLNTCYGFRIQNGLLRLPVRPRQYIHVKLNRHTLQVLSGLNPRSITLTPDSLSIIYSRETVEIKSEGYLGVDRNLNNVTIASTNGTVKTFDVSKATVIKSTYRFAQSQFKRTDFRIRTRIQGKYGEKQRNRVQPILHNVSKRIVEEAKTNRYGIVMERLTGLRRLYRKGNGQSRNYRARMNSWSYGELQRQIGYKARWEGVRVEYVPPRNTSKRCSICGYKTLESTKRRLWCPKCGTILDRDENAARNIAAGGLRFSPNGPPGEAMVEEREPENATLILKVDGGKLSQQPTTKGINPTKT